MIKTMLGKQLLDTVNTTITYKERFEEFDLTTVIKKGDILAVDFGINVGREKSGIRPAVVVSHNDFNNYHQNIVVAPATTFTNIIKHHKHGVFELIDTQFVLSKKYYAYLRSTTVVQVDDIRNISKKRIIMKIGELSDKSFNDMQECLYNMVGL